MGCPGICQLAGRIHSACQHICQRVAADIAQLCHEQDGIHTFYLPYRCQIYQTADIQDQNQMRILHGQGTDLLEFFLPELIISLFGIAVCALSGIPGNNIKSSIGLAVL